VWQRPRHLDELVPGDQAKVDVGVQGRGDCVRPALVALLITYHALLYEPGGTLTSRVLPPSSTAYGGTSSEPAVVAEMAPNTVTRRHPR
jgi:hypothetical protein